MLSVLLLLSLYLCVGMYIDRTSLCIIFYSIHLSMTTAQEDTIGASTDCAAVAVVGWGAH